MLITFAYRPGLISDDTKEEACERLWNSIFDLQNSSKENAVKDFKKRVVLLLFTMLKVWDLMKAKTIWNFLTQMKCNMNR